MQARSLLWLLLMLFGTSVSAQKPKGELRGKVIDATTRKPLDYAVLQLELNGIVKAQAQSDDEGDYHIKNIDSGSYSLRIAYTGYTNIILTDVDVLPGVITTQDIKMQSSGVSLKTVIVHKELIRLPQHSVHSVATLSAGVDSRSGKIPKMRGSRSDGTAYYINGVRVQGSPQNNERYAKIEENGYIPVKKEPLSTFSIDVDRASYANVRRFLNDNTLPPADAVRIEELVNYFTYDVKMEHSTHPFVISNEVSNAPWNSNTKLVHITLKAPEIDMNKAPLNNLTFLIDVSGSMMSDDKLPLLKDCLRMLVEQLRDSDKISIVVYAGAAGVVLEPTGGKNRERILDAINKLEAGGSTAGEEGIKLAYSLAKQNFIKEGNNRIILATDGDFNVGITDIRDLTKLIEEKRQTGIYLSVLGFGTGNINDPIMETLADKGNGNYSYIDGIREGKKVLVNEMGGTLFTVAKDVKIQVEFNPEYVKSYKLLGYENRLLNAEDFNNDQKDAGELGAGHCVTAIYEVITTGHDPRIDSLRYQKESVTTLTENTEFMNIKVRYKNPESSKSVKFEQPVYYKQQQLKDASAEMQFALAVAIFGLKLRNSSSVEDISYGQIIRMGKDSKGKDENGYRAEFIRLVETAELLASRH